jgi:beta-aspartyl-peptidase (threonine type)
VRVLLVEAIIVQAGAGSGKYAPDDRRFRELLSAVETGRAAMRRGSSLDGVEAAVRYMEECGAFNAGKGSCLTVERKLELDAAIMSGEGRRGAGVGVVTCTYHPVSLARWVMEKTPHVLIAGERCKGYLRAAGFEAERLRPSPTAKLRFKMLTEPGTEGRRKIDLWREFQEGNTVGAVAIDTAGVPSAAVSTGGLWLKLPGRVGDSAVIGAGIYADSKAGAASATGTGEEIIRNSLCLKACEYLMKTDAPGAARRAIELMTRVSGRGTAGIITVDLKGRVGAALNTEAMGRAWYDETKGRAVVQI